MSVDLFGWLGKLMFDELISIEVVGDLVKVIVKKGNYSVTHRITREQLLIQGDALLEGIINQAIRNVRVASGHLTTGTP